MFDVIVVGGGPAGLSAALMLGRCRRRVLVCDVGEPRNRRARALHGYLTRDGIEPRSLNDLGRAELGAYGVAFACVGVTGARRDGDGYRVSLTGGKEERARYLLLATGVIDDLPAISGFEACYGRSIFHCPYCDGWEWRDRRLATYGSGRSVAALALGLKTWSADVIAFTHGTVMERRLRDRLAHNGIPVRTEPIAALQHENGELAAVRLASGESLARDALFFATGQRPQSPLAIALGCTVTRRGVVKTGTLCATNIERVYVAGDASRDAQFAVVAAAEGVRAAVAINRALQAEELRA